MHVTLQLLPFDDIAISDFWAYIAPMPITHTELETTLKAAFPEARITLTDMAGDDDHWSAEVISPRFQGLSRIAQHRMVQEAVAHKNIHALAIKTGV